MTDLLQAVRELAEKWRASATINDDDYLIATRYENHTLRYCADELTALADRFKAQGAKAKWKQCPADGAECDLPECVKHCACRTATIPAIMREQIAKASKDGNA